MKLRFLTLLAFALAAVCGCLGVTDSAGRLAGLPVGLSIIGKPWNEKQRIAIARAFEQAIGARIASTH